jgi:hypothetical protein
MATKTHKGLLAECPVCTGFQPERKFKRKRTGVADTSARRQANLELGEDPTRIQKDAVFMKFGLIDPIIDRNVKKPSWKSEVVWQRELKQWQKDTAGMVPRQRFQESRRGYTPRTASSTLNQEFRPNRQWVRPNHNQNRQTPSLRPTEYRNSPRGS